MTVETPKRFFHEHSYRGDTRKVRNIGINLHTPGRPNESGGDSLSPTSVISEFSVESPVMFVTRSCLRPSRKAKWNNSPMKCYRCSNPATLHVTEIIKNVPHEIHLCEECAQQYLANPKSAFSNENSEEDDDVNEDVQAELEEIDKLVCPNCGISFKEFRSRGRLGCPHDYIAFQEELLPLLENIHGETQHVGRIPKRTPENGRKQFQLIKLRNDLRQAVAEESYEKAALLRDEIQSLERELKPS